MFKNSLEAKLCELNSDLREAELNNWEFDIANLKDEIREVERELDRQFKEATEY